MKKRNIIIIILIIILLLITLVFINIKKEKVPQKKIKTLKALVIANNNNNLILEDKNNIIYSINKSNINTKINKIINIKYTGRLDKNKLNQNISIIDYKENKTNKEEIPNIYLDNGLFNKYYNKAYTKLKTLSLEEKIGQIFLVRYPDTNQLEELKKYSFGGYLFFRKDFNNKTEQEVKNMISNLQKVSKTPILTAVDEEGGIVVRISSNKNLVNERFKSPQELYKEGGFDSIKKDTIYKSSILKNLGINLNLAPVVDISTNKDDYIYSRTIGLNKDFTKEYSKTVIKASKNTGVSYTLKHFPGYGSNKDTHKEITVDKRRYEDIKNNDMIPFKEGINEKAEAILVNHNIIENIDKTLPASLSPTIHNILRNDLKFTGIVITDDLDMGAITSINDSVLKAIISGNDLIITTDYENNINQVTKSIKDGMISEKLIDKMVFRILAWKYYKGLM